MSIVIPFAPSAKIARGSQEERAEPAQILFFTGVRYERQVESAPEVRQPRRRARPAGATSRSKTVRRPA